MSIKEKIFRKEPPKPEPKNEAVYVPVTTWPGISMMDMLSEYAMLEPLNRAYWMYHNVSIVADISKTITDEVFRNGLEWTKRFTKACSLCGYRIEEDADECPLCGSAELSEPDTRQQLLYYRANGKSYLEKANNFGQSLTAVLETMSIHIEVANRGALLVTKSYILNADGSIRAAVPSEIVALDPRYVFPVFDPRSGRMGDGSRTCIHCRERKKLSETQLTCPDCGRKTYEILYKTRMPQSPERYYINGEILMVSKYGYELFGFPLLLNAEDDVFLYYFLEKRPRLFYERAKSPGILFIPTNNPQQLGETWRAVSKDLEKDPYHFPVMGTPLEASKSAEFLKLMEDPSTDHIAIKTDALRRIGSLYGVAPLWQNDTSTSGGLNNESQQLTISNRAFERGQRLFNDDVLPWLSLQLGISDYVLKLKPSEDADELRDEQLLSAKLDNVQKALQVGLTVEWKNGELEISGTPQLQEQTNEPISIPGIPAASGEITKSGSSYTYNYYGTVEKSCPPGEHEHSDFPYCHPTEREHRSEGGRENESETPSENQAGEAETAQTALDDAETVDELGEALQTELKALIPDLQTDLALGDLKTCKTSMRRFVDLTKQYNTACRELKVKPLRDPSILAGTPANGSAIHMNTTYFSSNPGSTRPGSIRIEQTIKRSVSVGRNPPIREGEEVEAVITHEFGHTLKDPEFYESIVDIWQEYSEKFPDGVIDQEDPAFVSGYAATNEREFVSECLVSVMHTDNPSSTAKRIVEKIDQFFRREDQ